MASSIGLLLAVTLSVIHAICSEELGQEYLKHTSGDQEELDRRRAEQNFAGENTGDSVCYKDIGCFSKNGTFKHLLGLPDSPDVIQTSFALYTRKNLKKPVYLHYLNSTSIMDGNFDPNKKLKIICHGFAMSGDNDYIIDMKNAFLDKMDFNVIVVDWRRGALPPFYLSASLDTELVGRQVGRLVSLLIEKRGLDVNDVHVIGFSLGAHLAGFAGKWLKSEYRHTVARISALDPASFLFEGKGDHVHVSQKDALYVDVIHTSSGSSILSGQLGMTEAVGHVDFYPNGGKQQPGCSGLICNHMRALDLYTSSIDGSCEFRAVACDSFDLFDDGACFQSTTKQIGRMGYYSNTKSGRGTLYLATTGSLPFCGTSILVSQSVSENQKTTYGAVAITIIAADGTREIINLTDTKSQKVHPKETLQKLVVVNPSVFPLVELHVHYTQYNGWFYTGTKNFLFDYMRILDEAGHVWFDHNSPDTKVPSSKSIVLYPENYK